MKVRAMKTVMRMNKEAPPPALIANTIVKALVKAKRWGV